MWANEILRNGFLRLGVISLLILTACSSNASDLTTVDPTPATEGSFEIIGGTDEQLRQLVTHIMHPNYSGAVRDLKMEMFVASLPDQMPLDLPPPTGTTLIGSITKKGLDQDLTQVVYESSSSVQEVKAFFDAELPELGFVPWERQASGFVHDPGQSYCRTSDELHLILLVSDADPNTHGNKTEFQIHIRADSRYSPCDPDNSEMYADPQASSIPKLLSPPGAVIQEGGSGCEGNGGNCSTNAHSYVLLEADQDFKDLAVFYAAQLEAAGWQIDQQSHNELGSWMSWDLSNEYGDPMAGILLVVPGPNYPQVKFVFVRFDPK
ncbi:MAG: hypothetical protein DWQ07_24150 [Chloroflexi bacterium]|nr:MAG: hypothetical protein DWQ07_24150 [Chloroflexota bacterium]MBL1196226.1 hypothetical protein [Chloroflexota bacterium]NOH13520.1 hypothetical protein [Chloroflexota bacterium]